MTVSTFGVTAATVKTRHFPQWNAFSANSNPSATTVSELIDECAAELEARLLNEGITASAITDATSAPYLWCRKTLRLMVALEILTVATQQAPPLAASWQKQLDTRLEDLDTRGYLAIGTGTGVSQPALQPNGPRHHIDELSIDIGSDTQDASSAIPTLRRNDDL